METGDDVFRLDASSYEGVRRLAVFCVATSVQWAVAVAPFLPIPHGT